MKGNTLKRKTSLFPTWHHRSSSSSTVLPIEDRSNNNCLNYFLDFFYLMRPCIINAVFSGDVVLKAKINRNNNSFVFLFCYLWIIRRSCSFLADAFKRIFFPCTTKFFCCSCSCCFSCSSCCSSSCCCCPLLLLHHHFRTWYSFNMNSFLFSLFSS